MARKKIATTEKKEARTRKPRTELALALPGAEAVDATLLDQAVADLNQLYRAKGLETARAVAECVIQVFFDGNVENFRARHGTHMSFKELGKRDDLQVSYQFIWNSCAVVEQLRSFPQDIADALPMSHHKLLLPVKDEAKKKALAKAAVKDHLSKRDFEARVKAVRAEQKTDSRAGRPPLPAFAKAFAKLKQVAHLAQSESINSESFAHYSKTEARTLLDHLDKDIEALKGVAAAVHQIIAQ